jgi:3-methylfumaryl-CoA hydratase
MTTPGLAALQAWIGRTETVRDTLTPRLAAELAATLDLAEGAPVPLAAHWCLAPPIVPAAQLGPDGHPARGGFLPPVPLPRRMWAGSRLTLHDRLQIGDTVERVSRIADVSIKQGRTGSLCFVTVAHEIFSPRGLAVAENHDIVYRDITPPGGTKNPPALPVAEWSRPMRADAVLLFRYCAITFNGHRIHYDRAYATDVEFYPGLIVHGPLQASWLLEFAAGIKGSPPARFSFRGVSPLFDFAAFTLCARPVEDGLHLWIQTGEGIQTMDATAQW